MYASWFQFFSSNSIPRCCNRVADSLAHKACIGDSDIWLEEPLEDLVHLLSVDLAC